MVQGFVRELVDKCLMSRDVTDRIRLVRLLHRRLNPHVLPQNSSQYEGPGHPQRYRRHSLHVRHDVSSSSSRQPDCVPGRSVFQGGLCSRAVTGLCSRAECSRADCVPERTVFQGGHWTVFQGGMFQAGLFQGGLCSRAVVRCGC